MNAKADLAALLQQEECVDRRLDGGVAPPGTMRRRSAVLILFGPSTQVQQESGAEPGLDLLLLRRSDTMRHHPGQIAFPGGGIDHTDAGPEQAALREAYEETGLEPSGVEVLGVLPEVFLPVSNNMVSPVLAWWNAPGSTVAPAHETAEVFRVPVAQLLHPDSRATLVLGSGSAVHRGPAFRFHDGIRPRIVWGFTAILLAELFDRTGWAQPWDASRIISSPYADE